MQLESEVSNEQVPHLGLRCIIGPGEVQHLWCKPPIETSPILVLGLNCITHSCLLRNSYTEVLNPSTLKCDLIWREGFN